ncbi:PspC domain-containing protein [Aurantiacibacter sp. MUD61]|uniref:PspC domain-containing protein n=1 Tax=Aurantiacibacter sp. MUD61 TaxID=3009083 RepID=UPI0022F11D8C|nr:PspC domain-containing protein [Aurantiacibacter sp. MUD61]
MSNIQNKNANSPNKFRLDRVDGKIGGVCGGIANYMNVDPLIVRLIFAVGAIAGFGTFIVLYLAIWLLAK